MVARLRSWALAVWHFVSNAPLTYAWLVVLVITTIIQNNLTGSQLHFVLLHRSTNIAELGRDPLEVLFSSLLWIDGRNLEPYLLLFTLFLAPAEHWLGHLRWLTVGLTAHIGATAKACSIWRSSTETPPKGWCTLVISGSATSWSV